MLDGINQDLSQLHKMIEEACNLLEQQTYIQRNGDQYEYLTDKEKDTEQEIKNTDIETTDVARLKLAVRIPSRDSREGFMN